MPEWVLGYCPACGAVNPPKDRLCGNCGAPLLEVDPDPIPQPSALGSAFELREKIWKKQLELQDANSILLPLALGIMGVFTLIGVIGIVLIIVAIVWYKSKYDARPKIRKEILELEAQLREFERM
jgi:hypothetical protein